MSEIAEAAPEVVVTLDEAAARKLDGRIRRMGETFLRNWETLAGLVEEAKARRIHEALGFPSWPAYLADALGGQISVEGETPSRDGAVPRRGSPRGTRLRVIAPQLQPCVLDP